MRKRREEKAREKKKRKHRVKYHIIYVHINLLGRGKDKVLYELNGQERNHGIK